MESQRMWTQERRTKVNHDNISVLAVKVGQVTIGNVYKPPRIEWTFPLPTYEHPVVYMGDFNSHHQLWSYETNDTNGELIVDWALRKSLHLNFDAKDPQTFQSHTWNGVHNPGLCFVSTDINGIALPAARRVYHRFPKSQHRPVFLTGSIQIPMVNSLPKSSWNFRKANWQSFRTSIDRNIRWFKPGKKNIDRFFDVVMSAPKKKFLENFETTTFQHGLRSAKIYGSNITKLGTTKSERKSWGHWMNMDFKHSSKKACDLLKKLSRGSLNVNKNTTITPNQIATKLTESAKMQRKVPFDESTENWKKAGMDWRILRTMQHYTKTRRFFVGCIRRNSTNIIAVAGTLNSRILLTSVVS